MRKLIFKCDLSPGDIVMLTAAVRDLHQWYPRQFATDVRTLCPDLWENNPHITKLSEADPDTEQIECSYPLINECDRTPYHCLHGFIEFFNKRLGLCIRPTAFRGDIHLSAQEKAWSSQVHEVTREPIPFWVLAAGGKHDITVKWWEAARYQEVVNHFRGRVQFVQVGQSGHHHPRLEGVIDLRGQTSLRELVRLVYHSQGVLCPVTALMHLAAAVETRPPQHRNRPCVVVAGGREPPHWEAYPFHQFIHTVGALPCCSGGGCWKDRTFPLRDGDKRDHPDHLCVAVVKDLPACMNMITPAEVIRRVELYFRGGRLRYLNEPQRRAAILGIHATRRSHYDAEPLNLQSAGMACDRFISKIPHAPEWLVERGIVICGGGRKYFTPAWVCIRMLRHLGCGLPIQLWHLGHKEMDARTQALLKTLNVDCVDAFAIRKQHPVRILRGWELKAYAILHSPFRQVLLLDADNVPVLNPEFLFDAPRFRKTGAVFWPDYVTPRSRKTRSIWKSCGLKTPAEPTFETGQILVDKGRCWAALRLSLWFNENSDFYYLYVHGDAETFHLAFRKLKQPYHLLRHPVHGLDATMCQHDFEGRRLFQHRNLDKWRLDLQNRRVPDFWYENECRRFVRELRRK